ncbi:hypothetical protein GCM10028818_36330 [Spirosoma horti]
MHIAGSVFLLRRSSFIFVGKYLSCKDNYNVVIHSTAFEKTAAGVIKKIDRKSQYTEAGEGNDDAGASQMIDRLAIKLLADE